jgi:hypothetical protein
MHYRCVVIARSRLRLGRSNAATISNKAIANKMLKPMIASKKTGIIFQVAVSETGPSMVTVAGLDLHVQLPAPFPVHPSQQ